MSEGARTILAATLNKYGGMAIDADGLPEKPELFSRLLQQSLVSWIDEGVRVVWLPLERDQTKLIPVALATGFTFHHASDSSVMMILRIENEAPLPSYASHTIGAGGVVINEQNEVLTVLEKRDESRLPNHYKFPGGMLDAGEHIAEGVVREVFEETGVRTKFHSLLGMRHHHRGQFGTSNIYMVCCLTPLSREISIDESEIARASWIPVEDYLASEGIGLLNREMISRALANKGLESVKLDGYKGGPETYEIFAPTRD